MINDIRATVDNLLSRSGFTQPPVDIEKVASLSGVTEILKKPLDLDGMLIPAPNGYTIIVNRNQLPTRQRFTCAHEIGHILLSGKSCSAVRRRDGIISLYDRRRQPSEERVCDQIAAELLMPLVPFIDTAASHSWEIDAIRALADSFDTSLTATAIRFVSLIPEPCILLSWSYAHYPRRALSAIWSKQNSHCGTKSFFAPNRTRPIGKRVIHQALETDLLSSGSLTLGQMANGHAYYRRLYTEAIGMGKGKNRRVLSFSFPSRSSD